jgi:curved DNA-binding protein CbpA
MKDYYKILEVPRNAAQDEIKRAYRRLALLYHPDRNSSLHAQTLIQEINLAYDVIGDVKKRAAYDLRLKNYKTYQSSNTRTQNKRPATTTSDRRQKKKSDRFDYADWAKKGRFISAFILFYCSMLCIDYFLSSVYKNTVIKSFDFTAYRSKKSTSHYSFNIKSSKVDFELFSEVHTIKVGDTLDVSVTPFFGIVKDCQQIVNKEPRQMRHFISFYSPIMFLVVLLMAMNVAAILVKNEEQSFNFSIGNIIFFIILTLIRWLV